MSQNLSDAAVSGSRSPHLSAYALLLVMGAAWGLTISLAKFAGTQGGHPVGLALWQVVTSSTLMLLVSWILAGKPPVTPSVMRFGLVCGSSGVAFPAVALFWSALHLPAGVVAIAFASMPLFTYLWSVTFGVERGQIRRLFGVFIGLAAMALLVLPESALPAPDLAPWVLLALLASLSMSFENFYAGGYWPPRVAASHLACARQLGGVFWLLPIALATGTMVPLWDPWTSLQWAATGAGLLSGTAYAILLHVIRGAGPVFASQTAYLITLAGVAWGMLLFGERHSLYIWLALSLTLLAIALVRPQAPKRLKVAEG